MQGTKQLFEYGPDFNGQGNVVVAYSFDFSYIAACGENRIVYILDKRGKKLKETQLQNPGRVTLIDWDKDSEFVCIAQENLPFISLWNVFKEKVMELELDNNKARVSFAKWSKSHPVLAIGTDKGSLIFYNKKNQKKIPTMGKHAKKVISGDWNKEGLLITGGEDKILTVSNYNSDTQFDSVSVKAEPRQIQWARQKTDERDQQQRTICATLQQKSLLMFELNSTKQPLELVFESKYGKIVDYSLFGDGYIVVGFSEGYVAHISTHIRELRDEVSSERIFSTTLDQLITNDVLYKMAVAGENTVKIYNLATWKEVRNERIELPKYTGRITKLLWSQNGQSLLIATANGYFYGYLTSVPYLTTEYRNLAAILSSFTEVVVTQMANEKSVQIASVALEAEPQLIALGPFHLAVAMNNMVWYYLWNEHETQQRQKNIRKGGQLLFKRDYYSSVKKILLNNNWVAVYTEGKCTVHPLDPNPQVSQELEKRFPSQEGEKPIANIGMSDNFLILLDSMGKFKYFHLQDQQVILEYKSDKIISRIYPNYMGTKCICTDKNGANFLFTAASEQLIPILNFPSKAEQVIWDCQDPNIFIAIEREQIYTFVILKNSVQGAVVQPIRELLSIEDLNKPSQAAVTVLDKGLKPLIVKNGHIYCFTQTGQIMGQYLVSHSYINNWKEEGDSQEGHFRFFLQNLMLGRYSYCLLAAEHLNDQNLYEVLGRKCLEVLELDVASRAFQKANNLSMVLTIQSFKDESEKNILMGNVAMILGQYDLAQDLFLKSSKPQFALEMRSDIQDWLIALNLAKTIAPYQEPIICRRLAFQIESQGNYHEALRLYEKSLLQTNKVQNLTQAEIESHNLLCQAGLARTSIKLGDISRGFNLAQEIKDTQMCIEIAIVCENMKQLYEAAQLYEKGGLSEKAASLYIQLKMFSQATPLINKIKSPKLLTQLAKSKEQEGSYKDAEKAYEKAEDWENVIRLNITYLGDLEKAQAILRHKCPTATCASMVAAFCEKKGQKKEAIEFLVMAGKKEEAFILAQSINQMEVFADSLKDFTAEDRLKVAQYYEGKSQWGQAATHYDNGGNHQKALKLFKQAGDEYLDAAIEMIGRVNNENLTHQLLDYLMGEDEYGSPKDASYTYKVYRVLGLFKQAAKIAITIASQDQEQGNYKSAHSMLFETYKDMRANKINIPRDLYLKLLTLHSYVIVKKIVKLQIHEDAAKLLNRVCKNIIQFPAHAVNILTSSVIEAAKANFKYLAFQWACVLVRPDYRPQINEKYKQRIENIARKPIKEESYDVKTPCPFCQNLIDEFELECSSCQNTIPFCIASGKHILANECYFCSNCNFPSNIDYLRKVLEVENTCPMCNIEIDGFNIQMDADPIQKLKQMTAQSVNDQKNEENKQQNK